MIGSTLVFAVGLVVLAHIHSLGWFYVVEAIMGLGFGIYVAVDTALVIDVLPSKHDAAKDLVSCARGSLLSPALRRRLRAPENRPHTHQYEDDPPAHSDHRLDHRIEQRTSDAGH
ncbi:hypothetical protein [Fodinicola feengrottensis]|uniref:hypothetical protein n=1 Tax=Fodinicola feengrottensis TaxID=435914 RepID=UPI0036F3D020